MCEYFSLCWWYIVSCAFGHSSSTTAASVWTGIDVAWYVVECEKKSVCILYVLESLAGFEAECCNLVTSEGQVLIWANDIRYRGIYIVSVSSFKCFLGNAKRSFYLSSVNAIFEKLGRIASNEVIVQLIKTKCFPVRYYGLEACPLRKSQFSSLNFVINSSFSKVFDTGSQDVVDICLEMVNCVSAAQTVAMRKTKFLKRVSNSNTILYQTFAAEAAKELTTL